MSISATTRPDAPGRESTTSTIISSTMPSSTRMIDAGEFAEWAPVFDYRYGTPKAPVKAALKDGRDILFDIDWQGTQQLASAMGEDLVRIFILPPSMAELERRLHERGTDSEEVIAGRMRRAAGEISHWAEYDYVLINEDIGQMPRRGRGDRRRRAAQARAPGRAGRPSSATWSAPRLARAARGTAPRRGNRARRRRAPPRPRHPRPIARAASARRG